MGLNFHGGVYNSGFLDLDPSRGQRVEEYPGRIREIDYDGQERATITVQTPVEQLYIRRDCVNCAFPHERPGL
jgi:hypothetical protein